MTIFNLHHTTFLIAMKRKLWGAVFVYLVVVGASLPATLLAQGASPDNAELAAIRAAGDAYVAAMHRGDLKTLRSMWTDDGDYLDAAGMPHKARDLFPSSPDQRPAANGPIEVPPWERSLRLITLTVAIEDGVLQNVERADGSVCSRRFTAIWVKREGKWLLDGLREATTEGAVVQSQLRKLDWLIGEWAGKVKETEMLVSAHYSEDGNFLVRTCMVRAPGGEVLMGTERIGWDGDKETFKSWTFDSTGSASEAVWREVDGRWLVESSVVMPDGERATTQASYQPTGPDSFLWKVAESQLAADKLPAQQVEFRRAVEE